MTMRYTMQEMVDLAGKADQKIDAFIKTAAVLEEHQSGLEMQRRVTPDEKEAITKYLGGLNGKISDDLPASEILAGAGVRKVQGTSSYARRELKRVLQLTHASPPAGE